LLPDLDSMQVKVKIHESKVKKIRAGQKSTIRVEAFAGLSLHGTVEKVATLADNNNNWIGGSGKEFETLLKIDDLPEGAGLKPGFTAEVSVQVNHLPNVLAVPVQAVAEVKGRHYAYVASGGNVERREVTVGENNEKFVEVRQGLQEGESVCLDARARAMTESRSNDLREPSVTSKGPEPAVQVVASPR